jgi:phage gp46-like protein
MADIRLVPTRTADVITLDWLQTPLNLIDETNELATAVIIALCSDAQANEDDELPDPNSSDLRGWWGDDQAAEIWNGWPLGAKLWLLERSAIIGEGARIGATSARAQAYIAAAMQPFVEAKLCSRFTVDVQLVQQPGSQLQRLDASVVLYRGPKQAIALQFQDLWRQLFPGQSQL